MATAERDEALQTIFDESSGIARTAADASAIASEILGRLARALARGHELGDADLGRSDRRSVDRDVRDAAITAGRSCLAAMRGLVIAGEVDIVSPRPQDRNFDPLDDAWQRGGTSYLSAQRIVERQKERVEKLRAQPNQLCRRLAEAVAFAADLAGWAAWVDLPEAQ
jgi:hypothetical protein